MIRTDDPLTGIVGGSQSVASMASLMLCGRMAGWQVVRRLQLEVMELREVRVAVVKRLREAHFTGGSGREAGALSNHGHGWVAVRAAATAPSPPSFKQPRKVLAFLWCFCGALSVAAAPVVGRAAWAAGAGAADGGQGQGLGHVPHAREALLAGSCPPSHLPRGGGGPCAVADLGSGESQRRAPDQPTPALARRRRRRQSG
eukprot:COSAG01_NODE_13002_length_1650_cov_15.713088_2_plen_201_part_00